MELLLLGTAAAEGWPAPFCECDSCEKARTSGGRNIRARSSALLDNVVQIDFGPDTMARIQALGRKFTAITSLIFTHQHDDHLSAHELFYRCAPFSVHSDLPMLQVFGNQTVVEIMTSSHPDAAWREEKAHFCIEPPLEPFETRHADDGTTILALPADHAEESLVLRISRGERHVWYGHDSGQYADSVIEALRGVPLDVALFDCTYGKQFNLNRGHMAIDGVIEAVRRMREVGAITSSTKLIATHFSHNGRALYDDLLEHFKPHQIDVAYDGMTIEI